MKNKQPPVFKIKMTIEVWKKDSDEAFKPTLKLTEEVVGFLHNNRADLLISARSAIFGKLEYFGIDIKCMDWQYVTQPEFFAACSRDYLTSFDAEPNWVSAIDPTDVYLNGEERKKAIAAMAYLPEDLADQNEAYGNAGMEASLREKKQPAEFKSGLALAMAFTR